MKTSATDRCCCWRVVLGLAGVQLFCMGLLGELLMRTYHESQHRPIYRVRQVMRGAVEAER